MADEKAPDDDFGAGVLDMPTLSAEQKVIAAQDIIKKLVPVVRYLSQKERDRERTQKNYERIGYAVGAFVVGASGTIIVYIINYFFPGHKAPPT